MIFRIQLLEARRANMPAIDLTVARWSAVPDFRLADVTHQRFENPDAHFSRSTQTKGCHFLALGMWPASFTF